MRRLLAATIFGLVMLVTAPAALADDYPPPPPSSGVSQRATPPAPVVESEQVDDGLALTGTDVTRELGVGAALILLGGTILLIGRRRRGTIPG
jgi:hypothetical protein